MKTVFITCFTGLIARNILSTDAFSRLRDHPGMRMVIITPESRVPVLRAEFGAPNVIVEGVATPPLAGLDHLLWVMATNLLASGTRRVQRRAKLERDGNWLDYLASGLAGFLGRSRAVRQIFRLAFERLASGREFDYLFERYHPDVLFATDVYTPFDVKLARLAKDRNVKVVGMVRSWDNVTSKTLLTVIPDRLIVNTERIKAEAMGYGDVPEERISVVGVPHYDRYPDGSLRTPRAAFFEKIGLDPALGLILFTPPSDRYLKRDPVAPVVLKAIDALGAGVLVRFPLVGKTDLGGYRLPPNVAIDEPGTSPDFTEAHLSRSADQHLADSIYHAGLVITWASTMIIDSAVMDRPIILVGFGAAARPYGESILQYYDYDHQRRILETGGCRLARSPEELKEWAGRYLAYPSLDRHGRARIVREYCGALDGKAGERLADVILAVLGQ